MIAHKRFEENLHLQVPGKVFSESGPTVSLFIAIIIGKTSIDHDCISGNVEHIVSCKRLTFQTTL